jgi:multidrug efflux pump subunit AcrB
MNVDRPALIALVLFALLGLGFATFLGLSREPKATPAKKEQPNTEPEPLPMPRVVGSASRALHVAVAAPGFSIEENERTVATPLEHAFIGLNGFTSVRTTIQRGQCHLTLTLNGNRDENVARAEAINAIQRVSAQLPPGIAPPVLERRDPDALPALWIAISDDGKGSELEISDLARNEVRKNLLTIPGIVDVEVHGDRRRDTQLVIQPDKLQARGLTLNDVINAFAKADVSLDAEDLKKMESAVVAERNGTPILFRDVATIEEGTRRNGFARLDGKRIALAGVHHADGANAAEAAAAVRSRLQKLNVPENFKVEVVIDGTRPTREHLMAECVFPAGTNTEALEIGVSELEHAVRDQLVNTEVGPILTVGPKLNQGEPIAQMLFPVAPGHSLSINEIQSRIRKAPYEVPGTSLRFVDRSRGRADMPIRLLLVGDDLQTLRSLAEQVVRDARANASGLADVSTAGLIASPEIQATVNRERAAELGLTSRDVVDALQTAMGERTISVRGGSIRIVAGNVGRTPALEDIGEYPILLRDGKRAPLKTVAKLEQVESMTRIERINGQRCVAIVANTASGVSVAQAKANLRKIAENLKQPPGCQIVDD